MAAMTISLSEAKNNFSTLMAQVNESGCSVTVLRDNKPWVIISPVQSHTYPEKPLDVAVDFMDEYAGVFEKLAQ